MSDLDPSLCFDMSEYGHQGYDPGMGAPDPEDPVQDQYRGTWEMYIPPNDDPRVGEMLGQYVLKALTEPLVYLTNGEVEGITVGESVTFEAHVTGGGEPPYTYEWSTNKDNEGWLPVGGTNSTWNWTPGSGEEGTYAVKCVVTDAESDTGEVTWEGFVVSTP
jgi:hypothetical protein